ncbi:type IV pili methyl-accepting chemotaxis transducer N-terminal domain-containing protein [Maribacter sp. CXY002]|uniref:type IV pili methyl-accepting chemotaxis transducer N-terminal domain-containing protein n=1 Tax=Maribacter luteocoastalis TaxID=3407671 RepID=UPI003B683E67
MLKDILAKLKLGKSFNKYYLLVFTMIVLTLAIQSIIQYSLSRQEHDALRINVAGKQRMRSQMLVKQVYECRYANCNYGKLRLVLNRLANTNKSLQEGNNTIGLEPLEDDNIQMSFDKLQPHLNYILEKLSDFERLENISLVELSTEVDSFLVIMDAIVNQFQKSSEKDIRALMIVELELAMLTLVIIIFEIFYFINPSIRKITRQNQKLKEISWHQTHAFKSHISNIKKLQYVIGIEKNMDYKEELIGCLMGELNDLQAVSNNMVKSLAKED